MLTLGYAILFLLESCSANSSYGDLKEAFTSFLITPFVTPVVPAQELSARFYSDKISLGNRIPAYVGANPPVVYYDANPKDLYTLIIVDADPPSALAPVDSQGLHALLVNIRGNNLEQCNYITPWRPINPYPGSGFHRYVLLVYKQPCSIDAGTPYLQNLNINYLNFSVKNFVREYKLGNPIAGNFFLAQLTVCEGDNQYSKCSLYRD